MPAREYPRPVFLRRSCSGDYVFGLSTAFFFRSGWGPDFRGLPHEGSGPRVLPFGVGVLQKHLRVLHFSRKGPPGQGPVLVGGRSPWGSGGKPPNLSRVEGLGCPVWGPGFSVLETGFSVARPGFTGSRLKTPKASPETEKPGSGSDVKYEVSVGVRGGTPR